MRIKSILAMMLIGTLLLSTGCGLIGGDKDPLDPDKPTTVTLWHYYNGTIKDNFDQLVASFNETVGMERGIVIDAQSLGDVQQLADSVYNAANKTIGAQPLPDIFMAYPDNAYRVNQITPLLSLESLFSREELDQFRPEFLQEGKFGLDDQLLILPIAKSSENLYINKTDWDKFAQETGADVARLSTWEGVLEVAKQYHDYSGKAFLGIDANANYMLLATMQLGEEMYDYGPEGTKLNFREDIARSIWTYFYTPYIQGYFEKNGRFSSDDAKTGTVLAYTGSTAGAAYFPVEVTDEDGSVHAIEPMTLPYPYFASGKPYAIQQGAGMCVTKSDEAHEYAAGVFLKWFVQPEQNLAFAVSSGYFPVTREALTRERMMAEMEKSGTPAGAIPQMMESTLSMFDSYTLYGNKPFEGSYEVRSLLETHLSGKITQDLISLAERTAAGEERGTIIAEMTSEAEFQQWYAQFIKEADLILTAGTK